MIRLFSFLKNAFHDFFLLTNIFFMQNSGNLVASIYLDLVYLK